MARDHWFGAVTFVVAALISIPDRQSAPSLGGYSLGQEWMVTGRTLPCRRPLANDRPRTLDTLVRFCRANDSTQLTFHRDVLTRIEVQSEASGPPLAPGDDERHVTHVWLSTVSQRAEPLFGTPDSVSIVKHDLDVSNTFGQRSIALLALWHSATYRTWSAHVCIKATTRSSIVEPSSTTRITTVLARPGWAYPEICAF